MADTQKIIKINPELFRIPTTNKTRKNNNNSIRIKNTKSIKNNINRNILNHIRNKQEELFNNIVADSKSSENKETKGGAKLPSENKGFESAKDSFETDFSKAMQHMESLVHKNEPLKVNNTVNNENVALNKGSKQVQNQPTYGCLRGGTLPTYRTLKNNKPPTLALSTPSPPNNAFTHLLPANSTNQMNPIMGEINRQNLQEIQQIKELNHRKKIVTKRPLKQKKTLKRKFNVGKSKVYSKIGVLISNRTIRAQTLNKGNLLKQTPINEIKKILIKKGLIKVGSTAPNDVLRKMYESVTFIVGDVQNHNKEMLLHNYIHNE
jgi:hypothetical protein